MRTMVPNARAWVKRARSAAFVTHSSLRLVEAIRSPRAWLALLGLVIAMLVQDSIETTLYDPIAHRAGLHMMHAGMMMPFAYGALMVFRLIWASIVVCWVCICLGHRYVGFPLTGVNAARYFSLGLMTGLTVMITAIVAIIVLGNAQVSVAAQPLAASLEFGSSWLVFDVIGAVGEEFMGRIAVLLVAQRFFGRAGAILVSGLMFSMIHLGNPGASVLWLVRLALQGMLLAYAVYRTRSVWWSVGYHAGWNWASAPLFGAAGSGYLDQGHLLDFHADGARWVTGGSVGPEGSVFAFVAVMAALAILATTTKGRTRRTNAARASASG